MFETELNHYLQSFSAPWLDAFMLGVSWTGGQTFIVGILCLIALGVDLKRGFLLVQIFLITVISTDILKTLFELPRPFFVDASLLDYGALAEGVKALENGAATSFFGALPEYSISAFRALEFHEEGYGLPSGHTTGAVALWGGLAIVFRQKLLGYFAVLMITLMMISRLYLARHFLGDVLAGLCLATALLLMSAFILERTNWEKLFDKAGFLSLGNMGFVSLLGLGIFLPVVLLAWGEGHLGRVAALSAVNVALIVLVGGGMPFDIGRMGHRVLRVVLGFGLYFALNSIVKLIPLPVESTLFIVIKGFIPVFGLFVIAPSLVRLSMRRKIQV